MPRALVIPGPGDAPRLARLDRRIVRASAIPGGGGGGGGHAAPCCCGEPTPPPPPVGCQCQTSPGCQGVPPIIGERFVRQTTVATQIIWQRQRQLCCLPLQHTGAMTVRAGSTGAGFTTLCETTVSGSNGVWTGIGRKWINGLLVRETPFNSTGFPTCRRVLASVTEVPGEPQCFRTPAPTLLFEGEELDTAEYVNSWAVYRGGSPLVDSWRETQSTFTTSPNPCLSGCAACCLPQGGCLMASPAACVAAGGTAHPGLTCVDVGVPCGAAAVGACCRPVGQGGGCLTVSGAVCAGIGGTFLGAGVGCAQAACAQGPSGCCLPNGSCVLLSSADCMAAGGLPLGPGNPCLADVCPAAELGACCQTNGTCSQQTLAACTGQGGAWAGPNVPCGPVGCPVGACCFSDGSCALRTGLACAAQGGFYRGDASQCLTESCVGACCVGTTCSVVTAAACAAQSGTWHGPGSQCASVPPQVGPDSIVVSCSGTAGQSATRVGPMQRPSLRVYPYGPLTLVAPAPQTSGRRPGRGCGSCGQSVGELG